jgi:hypothetical protein
LILSAKKGGECYGIPHWLKGRNIREVPATIMNNVRYL